MDTSPRKEVSVPIQTDKDSIRGNKIGDISLMNKKSMRTRK
jgi:hypothetical protein